MTCCCVPACLAELPVTTQILFESPWLLVPLLVAVLVVLVGVRAFYPTRRTARLVWVWVVVAPLLVVVQALVDTPRERIVEMCHELAAAVETGDLEIIGGRLAPGFSAEQLDRAAFLALVERTLTRYDVRGPTVSAFDITFLDDATARVEFYSRCGVGADEFEAREVVARWRLSCRKTQADWRVTSVEILPTPLSPLRSLRDVMH